MTPDARYLVFVSSSLDLPGGSLAHPGQVYRRDMLTGTTRLVSASWYGAPADAAASPEQLAVSPTGRYVAYVSRASNIPVRNRSTVLRLFVRDLESHQTFVANSRRDAAVSEEAGVWP